MDFCNNIETMTQYANWFSSDQLYAYCIQYENFLYAWNAWPSICQNNRAYYKEYCILQYSVVGLTNMKTMWDAQIFLQNGCSNCVVKAGNAMVILLPEAMMQHPVPLESMWVWEKMERRRKAGIGAGTGKLNPYDAWSGWKHRWLCAGYSGNTEVLYLQHTHTVKWLSLDSTYFNTLSFYLPASFDGIR